MKKQPMKLASVPAALTNYARPGNVRELENEIKLLGDLHAPNQHHGRRSFRSIEKSRRRRPMGSLS
jgi:transcriptional regulator with AAA-type ATPase domain